jgi:hypothetical protein
MVKFINLICFGIGWARHRPSAAQRTVWFARPIRHATVDFQLDLKGPTRLPREPEAARQVRLVVVRPSPLPSPPSRVP